MKANFVKQTIVWTRSRQDWDADRQHFSGVPVLHLPCISTEVLEVPELPDIEGARVVVVFTSPRAVGFAFACRQLVEVFRGARIVSVGDGTARQVSCQMQILGERRFPRPPNPPSPYLKDFHFQKEDIVLLPGPVERALPLAQQLKAQGLRCYPLDLYRTKSLLMFSDGKLPTPEQKHTLVETLAGVVCFLSPSAFYGFRDALMIGENRLRESLSAIVIGQTTRKACERCFDDIHVAKDHSVESVISLATSLLQNKA